MAADINTTGSSSKVLSRESNAGQVQALNSLTNVLGALRDLHVDWHSPSRSKIWAADPSHYAFKEMPKFVRIPEGGDLMQMVYV